MARATSLRSGRLSIWAGFAKLPRCVLILQQPLALKDLSRKALLNDKVLHRALSRLWVTVFVLSFQAPRNAGSLLVRAFNV